MNSLEEYGALFERLGLTELEVQEGDYKLKLKKDSKVSEPNALNPGANQTNTGLLPDESAKELSRNANSTGKPENPNNKNTNEEDIVIGEAIKAPLLGIFYATFGDKKAVREGDCVKEGDVLCTIEAMKMMNEVKATRSGVITKICAKDGDLVEYNQELFIVA